MANKKNEYTNESISMLKGADRVRLKPSVIFGSDGLEGCEHAFFEILSNSIDEAKEGYGTVIEVKRYLDKSIEVTDMGRGIPLDFNAKENRFLGYLGEYLLSIFLFQKLKNPNFKLKELDGTFISRDYIKYEKRMKKYKLLAKITVGKKRKK